MTCYTRKSPSWKNANLFLFLFQPKVKVSGQDKLLLRQVSIKGIQKQIPVYQRKTQDAETEESKFIHGIQISSPYSTKMCSSLAGDSEEIKSKGVG